MATSVHPQYHYNYQPIRRKKKPNTLKKIGGVSISIFIIVLITLFYNQRNNDQDTQSGNSEKSATGQTLGAKWGFTGKESEIPTPTPIPFKQNTELLSLVQAKIPNDNGEYGVVVLGLNGGESYQIAINEREVFPAASLYKLFLMATALEKIEHGQIRNDTVVSVQDYHLEQVLGSVDFGYDNSNGSTISYTIDQILDRIARVSDNYASIMLAEKIGWDDVRSMAQRLGCTDTSIKDPISTTPKDIAHFFQLLYEKKIVSPTSSDKLTELLLRSQLNDRIPDLLPTELKIAHKTGELNRVRNDAGIIYLEKTDKNKGPYIIVLMSKDLVGEDSGVDTLSDISKTVYDFFNK